MAAAFLLVSGLPALWGQQLSQPGRERTASRGSKSSPLTLDEAKDLVSAIKSGGIAFEKRVIGIIEARGISFFDEEANLAALRESGATDGVIATIQKIAPPRPPTTGTLTLRCAPAECRIKLNDRPVGITVNGRLVLVALPAGEVAVDFAKDGYDTQRKTAQVVAGGALEVAVTLAPDSATRAQNGKRLLSLMLSALGMGSGAAEFPPLTGRGSMTSYAEGKQSDWNFDWGAGSSSLIEMGAESPAGVLIYQCNGQRCSERKKGHLSIRGSKGISPAVAVELETNLRAFAQYHLGPVLQNLLSRPAQLAAATADDKPGAQQQFRAELSDVVYNVTLGPDLLPTVVKYDSKAGLGSGLQILFSDYEEIPRDGKQASSGVLRYPRRTTIRLPDSDEHGIEVRLDRVGPWSAFRTSDFGK